MPLIDDGPEVRLRNHFERPYDDAIAAARTCYSPRVVFADEVTERQRKSIGPLTFEGGHHTVYQHATFEFALSGVSRQLAWCFLHAFPFYNTEQQSQRYVRLDEVRALVPPELGGAARELYVSAVERAWQAYAELTRRLQPVTLAILSDLWRLRERQSHAFGRNLRREAEKKAIETARYVIPLASHTAMVYTVSGITLHRLRRMAAACDAPSEARRVVDLMLAEVERVDPAFFREVGEPPLELEETVEERVAPPGSGDPAALEAFDKSLRGQRSRLVDWSARGPEVVADAVRHVLGRPELADDEALELVARPGSEPLPAGHAERLLPRAADAQPRPRALQLPQETLAHRRLAGPATPHGAGLAAAAHAHRAAPARRRRARADRERPRLPRAVRRGGRGRLRRARAAAGARRGAGARALPAAQRAGGALRGVRLAAPPAPQVDDAHLPERAARDLGGLDAGDRAGARACTRSSCATSGRPAWCATASCARAAPRARISAACRSGGASRTSSAASDARRPPRDRPASPPPASACSSSPRRLAPSTWSAPGTCSSTTRTAPPRTPTRSAGRTASGCSSTTANACAGSTTRSSCCPTTAAASRAAAACSPTGRRTPSQAAELAGGPTVNSRGSKSKSLRGSDAAGWKSTSTQQRSVAFITYEENWSDRGPARTSPSSRAPTSLGGGNAEDAEGPHALRSERGERRRQAGARAATTATARARAALR